LPARHVDLLWQCVDALVLTERQMAHMERAISEVLLRDSFQEVYGILTSFPGVGTIAAATVIAEIGDFKRFADGKAIGRYAGLNPRVYASGGKQRIGHIAKTGSPDLRWILQQVAWTAIRFDESVRRLFLRLAKRSGRKAAAVAVARKMLTSMHRAVVNGELYRTRVAA
jgi:transposase